MLGRMTQEPPGKKPLILYGGVKKNEDPKGTELAYRAKSMGAICFDRELKDINLSHQCKKASIKLFAISEDEHKNHEDGLALAEKYRERPKTNLLVFTSAPESEILFASTADSKQKKRINDTIDAVYSRLVPNGELLQANEDELKQFLDAADQLFHVRRINPVRSLIDSVLYEDARSRRKEGVFGNARVISENEKQISAVIVGLGQYGSEMLKALCWFCQMDGYSLNIDAFDRDDQAESRLRAACPELMEMSGQTIPGESQYTIQIHCGEEYAVNTNSFAETLRSILEPTYVLVSLGSDMENIRAVMRLRMLFERQGWQPSIDTVVYSSQDKAALMGRDEQIDQNQGTKANDKPYGIRYIGDYGSVFSERVILHSELEKEAIKIHLTWTIRKIRDHAAENGGLRKSDVQNLIEKYFSFWSSEYNYRSSIASAMHTAAVCACGKMEPGAVLSSAQIGSLAKLEHKRWNAYMRSEGYVFGDVKNQLAKTHPCLVPWEKLDSDTKEYDIAAVKTRVKQEAEHEKI